MISDPTEPFVIDGRATGRFEERVAHIADCSIPTEHDDPLFENDNIHNYRCNDQILCTRGHWRGQDESHDLTLAEAANLYGFDKTSFKGEAPEKVCSNCWNDAKEEVSKLRTIIESGLTLGEAGYRMRWKLKGKARKRWMDVIVSPSATMQDVDDLLTDGFGLGDRGYRVYGLEDEYSESSIGLLPEKMYNRLGNPSDQNAAEITVSEFTKDHRLWEDDRLTISYKTSHDTYCYYCILKDVLSKEDLSKLRSKHDTNSDTQAFVTEVGWN